MLNTCSGWRVRTRVVMDGVFAWGVGGFGSIESGRVVVVVGKARPGAWAKPFGRDRLGFAFWRQFGRSKRRKTRHDGRDTRVKMLSEKILGGGLGEKRCWCRESNRGNCRSSLEIVWDGRDEEARCNFLAHCLHRFAGGHNASPF